MMYVSYGTVVGSSYGTLFRYVRVRIVPGTIRVFIIQVRTYWYVQYVSYIKRTTPTYKALVWRKTGQHDALPRNLKQNINLPDFEK